MTVTSLLAAVAGAVVAAGILLVIAALTPRPAPVPVRSPRAARASFRRASSLPAGWARVRWPVAVAAGVAGWAVTGWPVIGAAAAGCVIAGPALFASSRSAARGIARVEAVEEWTRRLADVLSVGVGLEQAITSSTRTVPDPIRSEVSALAARLTARWPTETALRLFADDLDDATGDLVVAALVLGARRRGPGLAKALSAVADAAGEEVATRRRIEADRARPRATARAVTAITLAVIAVGLANRDYLAPYGTPLGQVVLACIAAGFATSLWWMHAMTATPPTPRLLTRHPAPDVTAPVTGAVARATAGHAGRAGGRP